MERRKTLYPLVLIISSLIFLSACGTDSVRPRLSDEEISALRQEYPYDEQSAASTSNAEIDRVVHLIDAVVVIKIEGDSFTNPVFASPVDDPSAPFSNTVDCEYLQAHIEKVLFDSAGLSESDTVNLFFGSVLYAGSLEAFKTGERYLCLINKPDEDELFAYDETVFSCSKNSSAYLTKDNFLLALTQQGYLEEYTGYSLEAFCKELLPLLSQRETTGQ